MATARYYKFTVTAIRSGGEFPAFNELTFRVGTTRNAASSMTFDGTDDSDADRLNDNDSATDWFNFSAGPWGILVDMGASPPAIDGYDWMTNHFSEDRDNIRWTLEGKVDSGDSYTMLDDKSGSDQTVTSSRQTNTSTFSIDSDLGGGGGISIPVVRNHLINQGIA